MKKQKVMNKLRQFTFIMGLLAALVMLPSLLSAQKGSNNNSNVISLAPAPVQAIDANSVTWKTSAQALPLVEQRFAQLENQLTQLTPNTAAYNEANARFFFFKSVLTGLEAGQSVRDAVSKTRLSDSLPMMSRTLFITIRNEATTLLSN